MLLEVLPWTGGLVVEAAESPHSVSNGKWKTSADMGWMRAARQQELTDLAWLLVQISLDVTFGVDPNVDVQKVDRPGVEVVVEGELDGGVVVVAVHHELFQLLLQPLPDEEDVINEPPPHVHCCS